MSSEEGNARKKLKIAGTIHDGTPPLIPSGDVQTIVFNIHNFEERSQKKGQSFLTEAITCGGYKWCVIIYPRGNEEAKDGYASIYLLRKEFEDGLKVTASATFRCKTWKRDMIKHVFSSASRSWGYENWMERSKVIRDLLDSEGTLTVEVNLDIYIDKKKVWYPRLLKDVAIISEFYHDEEMFDITFLVDGAEFSCHKLILKNQAAALFQMAEENDGPISITDVDKDTFAVVHQFIYTVLDVEDAKMWANLENTQSICLAADRFGCTALKLYAESVLVEKFLDPITCPSLLTMADAHSCTLLKEACHELYKKDAAAVRKSTGWKEMVAESPKLLDGLLEFVSLEVPIYSAKDPSTWDVTTLRTKLDEAKLDIDGTKSMLIKRWNDRAGNKK